MAYKMNIERTQETFLPSVIDDYVGPNDRVRVYDAFVEALNFPELGISLIPSGGAESYYPKQLMKLIIYGYSYGDRSSRSMERACHHNLSYIWLMSNLKPDYRTIARFRSEHKEAVTKILKQCARLCIKMDLIDGNEIFTDGSKFRANASLDKTYSREHLEKELKSLDDHIDRLVEESEKIDEQEADQTSKVKSKQEIADKEQFKKEIQEYLEFMKTEEKSSLNTTDADSVRAKTRQGTHAVHNVQTTTDGKHGLIIHAESVGTSNDNPHLPSQVKAAMDVLEKKVKSCTADAGYYSPEQLPKIEEGIMVIVPTPQEAQQEKNPTPPDPFAKNNFYYDKEHNDYICPEGKHLPFRGQDTADPRRLIYQASAHDCRECPSRERCTTSAKGRRIIRYTHEEFRQHLQKVYRSEEAQKIYRRRKFIAETPHGHIKKNLQAGQFLLRGKPKVDAEVSVLATCFNIVRMMTIKGIAPLIAQLKEMANSSRLLKMT